MSEGITLVTGASGYVGGRLVGQLLAAGHSVRVLARQPEKLRDATWFDDVEVIAGDATDPSVLARALDGVGVAYYLLHSLQLGSNLEEAESAMAALFASAM